MKNVMKEVIKNGVDNAPAMGIDSAFYKRQFVPTRKEWESKKKEVKEMGFRLAEEIYSSGGGVGPCGVVVEKKIDNYVYLYLVNSKGNWESQYFTHKVIAG